MQLRSLCSRERREKVAGGTGRAIDLHFFLKATIADSTAKYKLTVDSLSELEKSGIKWMPLEDVSGFSE